MPDSTHWSTADYIIYSRRDPHRRWSALVADVKVSDCGFSSFAARPGQRRWRVPPTITYTRWIVLRPFGYGRNTPRIFHAIRR